jgi:tetratricopeptide (TPR) repeat protein
LKFGKGWLSCHKDSPAAGHSFPLPIESIAISFTRHRVLSIVVCVIGLCGVAVLWWSSSSGERPVEEVLRQAQKAFAQGDPETARSLTRQLLQRSPDHVDALLLSADAAIHLGFCTEAEQNLRRVVAVDSGNAEAHRRLVHLLKMQGRYWELHPHALALFQAGDSGNEFLIPLAAPDGITISEAEFQQAQFCKQAAPTDTSAQLGLARHMLWNAEVQNARQLLERIVADSPDNAEAQAQLGTVLLQVDDDDEAFFRWHSQLPETAYEHPEIWFLQGARASGLQRPDAAIHCYYQALVRDPNHRRAAFQLAQALAAVGDTDKADRFLERFRLLEEVARLATRGDDASGSQMTAATMSRIAAAMEQLGRLRESVGWYQQAQQRDTNPAATDDHLQSLIQQIDDSTPLTLVASNPASQLDLSSYPPPEWPTTNTARQPSSEVPADQPAISFTDEAAASGLSFRFHNGADPQSGLARMFEFSGGGVAVVDVDGDLWPDLYLTQGTSWPPSNAGHRDRLFRNISGERFADLSEPSGLTDKRYSQGPAVGDYDNDGFPDIALANIGGNRLYRNNGDGTFSDISTEAGIEGDVWTSGCLLADLNGDGLPDLYDVNYLAGTEIFTRRCELNGRPIQCPLHYFPSEQDQVYVSLGDGTFSNVTATSGIELPEGKGMGCVAADFDQSGRLSLFVANDDKPNFFFVSTADDNDTHTLRFAEQGVVSGLAFGNMGDAQSCMGTAAADTNNDGLLDLFVTNFANEPNNFYVQQPGGFFVDQSQSAGLHLPGLKPMGWGAQFLDGDLDGLPDLLVANGHLDLNTADRLPYSMKAQFFHNLGQNRFSDTLPQSPGPYFERFHVGRAVARMDWNRDGADDACITHVESPVALLTNRTLGRGTFLSIHLRGRLCSRDAIGSVVRISAGGQTLYQHLTAGDGFQSSNHRKLTFGFGDVQQIDEIEIRWPSGTSQVMKGPALNSEVLIVEGQQPRTVPE